MTNSSELIFIEPTDEHEEAVLELRKELLKEDPVVIHGAPFLKETEDYSLWLSLIQKGFSMDSQSDDWVKATTFLIYRQADMKLVGINNIRHELNAFLREFGGHVGCSILPSMRHHGYSIKSLTFTLNFCRELGLKEALVSCAVENEGSLDTILDCGGILTHEMIYPDGTPMQMYKISL